MAIILNGKSLSDVLAEQLTKEVKLFPTKPTLVIIQIGDVAESNIYIKRKLLCGKSIGAEVIHKKYTENTEEQDIVDAIQNFNKDDSIHGIIVQLPIPEYFDKNRIIESIDPIKDIDGLTAQNIKHLCTDNTGIIPATTRGILTLLRYHEIELEGKHVVMVGRSTLVGKPTALACINENATVTVCHSYTKDLANITKTANILITATGKENLITTEHVCEGQIIIDVGIHVVEDSVNKIAGDVDFKKVEQVVAGISPVPRGVGPMTVISLFENLVDAYKKYAS